MILKIIIIISVMFLSLRSSQQNKLEQFIKPIRCQFSHCKQPRERSQNKNQQHKEQAEKICRKTRDSEGSIEVQVVEERIRKLGTSRAVVDNRLTLQKQNINIEIHKQLQRQVILGRLQESNYQKKISLLNEKIDELNWQNKLLKQTQLAISLENTNKQVCRLQMELALSKQAQLKINDDRILDKQIFSDKQCQLLLRVQCLQAQLLRNGQTHQDQIRDFDILNRNIKLDNQQKERQIARCNQTITQLQEQCRLNAQNYQSLCKSLEEQKLRYAELLNEYETKNERVNELILNYQNELSNLNLSLRQAQILNQETVLKYQEIDKHNIFKIQQNAQSICHLQSLLQASNTKLLQIQRQSILQKQVLIKSNNELLNQIAILEIIKTQLNDKIGCIQQNLNHKEIECKTLHGQLEYQKHKFIQQFSDLKQQINKWKVLYQHKSSQLSQIKQHVKPHITHKQIQCRLVDAEQYQNINKQLAAELESSNKRIVEQQKNNSTEVRKLQIEIYSKQNYIEHLCMRVKSLEEQNMYKSQVIEQLKHNQRESSSQLERLNCIITDSSEREKQISAKYEEKLIERLLDIQKSISQQKEISLKNELLMTQLKQKDVEFDTLMTNTLELKNKVSFLQLEIQKVNSENGQQYMNMKNMFLQLDDHQLLKCIDDRLVLIENLVKRYNFMLQLSKNEKQKIVRYQTLIMKMEQINKEERQKLETEFKREYEEVYQKYLKYKRIVQKQKQRKEIQRGIIKDSNNFNQEVVQRCKKIIS